MPAALTRAALGFRSHSGWAAVVCLAGPTVAPTVVERSRLLLTSGLLPNEPYHRAKDRAPDEARRIVAAAADEARVLASEAIASLVSAQAVRGYTVSAAGVSLGSGRPDFTLKQALATHAAMHKAEGWLRREALLQASRDRGLRPLGVPEQNLYSDAAAALGVDVSEMERLIRELGRFMGAPWSADQKLACAAGWLALLSMPAPSRGGA